MKTFEPFTGCHIRACQFLRRGTILKVLSAIFEGGLCSFWWLWGERSSKGRFRVLGQGPAPALPYGLMEDALGWLGDGSCRGLWLLFGLAWCFPGCGVAYGLCIKSRARHAHPAFRGSSCCQASVTLYLWFRF